MPEARLFRKAGSLHCHTLRGQPGRCWQSEEFRFYLTLIAGATAVISLVIMLSKHAYLPRLIHPREVAA